MKMIILLLSLLSLNSAYTKEKNEKIEVLKCIRGLTETRVETNKVIPIAYSLLLNLFKDHENDFEVSKIKSECELVKDEINLLPKIGKKKLKYSIIDELRILDEEISPDPRNLERKALNLLRDLSLPYLIECKATGITATAAVVVGIGGSIGIGYCEASNGRIYQAIITERMTTYGVGAFTGVYAGKIARTDRKYIDGMSLALGVGFSAALGPKSLGIGATFSFNDVVADIKMGFKIKNSNFKRLIDKLEDNEYVQLLF